MNRTKISRNLTDIIIPIICQVVQLFCARDRSHLLDLPVYGHGQGIANEETKQATSHGVKFTRHSLVDKLLRWTEFLGKTLLGGLRLFSLQCHQRLETMASENQPTKPGQCLSHQLWLGRRQLLISDKPMSCESSSCAGCLAR